MDPSTVSGLSDILNPWIYGICALISILTVFCILGFTLKLKKAPNTRIRDKILVSAGVGLLFWVTQLLFYTSLRFSVSPDWKNAIFLPVFIILCYILFHLISAGKVGRGKSKKYAEVCIYMTAALLAADYTGFYPLYADSMDFNIQLAILTAAIIAGTVFSGAQLLFLVLEEEAERTALYWSTAGSILIGMGLSVLPYMIIFSVLAIEDQHHPFVLLPYTIGLIAMTALEFIPSYYAYSKLNVQKEEYASLYQNNLDAVFTLDAAGIIKGCNRAAVLMTGYAENELLGKSYSLLGTGGELGEFYKEKAVSGEAFSAEVDVAKKDGTVFKVIASIISITAQGRDKGLYAILKDMTEIREAEETIQYMAYFDELTELPNQKKFRMMIKELTVPYTLVSICISNLSSITELYGEKAGEEVIKSAAGMLAKNLPPGSLLAYTDTSVFSLAITGKRPEELNKSRFFELEKPVFFKDTIINMTVAAGAAVYPYDSPSHDDVYKYAGMALTVALEKSTEKHQVFSSKLNEDYHRQLYMENELRKAIQAGELNVHYQPKFNLESGMFNSAEALVRWSHPELGHVSPGIFIPIAEKTGLIRSLEKFVLSTAFLQMKEWQKAGYPFKRVAVNFSHYHFYDDGIVDTVKEVLDATGLDPNCAEIEITESSMIENKADTISKLHDLKDLGIKISLDDFGTGYSSLSYLQELPIDVLKIDRSFINKINTSSQSNAILSSIISMARDLELEIVAEGVETKEQLEFLGSLKCPSIQGFYFSPPLPAAELGDFISQYH
ncbi:putative bifunctional diguanylate cyclase/phosphodiesterase [Metabacillus mangrovi]|uniref:putative bifunctional diguanylate cyclase/phosphodiesterase n=1 Tax=Metabacillus mangrovi TaxID=1491830 RepID=UPI0013915346